MAKKSVTAQTPKNTDGLKINDIINQKVDVPSGQQLTYLPVTGAVASSSVANQGPLNVLDSSPDTYWQPSDQVAGAHVELQTPNPYECYGVDIKFKESEGKKFNLKVDILDKEHNRWLTIATAESSLIDDNKYERFHAAQHFKSDTYRVIINSVFDTTTNSIYTQPKITQIRLFGLVPDADVAKYKVIKDQECPEGYGKDAESGQCVKSIPSEIIKPKDIDAHSAVDMGTEEPTGNNPENLLSIDPNDKLTLKGVGSTIEYGLARTDAVYGVYIHKLNNPPRQYTLLTAFYNGQDKQPFYSFVVDIPDSQDKYVHLLNQPIRADRFVLSVVDNTEPNQWFSLFGLYLIGQPNAGPEETEPPVPKSCSIKQGGWGSSSDNKPEEWKVTEMTDDKHKGKFKGVGKDNKNVFHLCDSKDDAEAFIKRKIWESKQKPPTEPPVEPPIEPPVEPPTTGGGTTKDGVKIPYETTGKMEYTFRHNDRDDGKRMDFNNLKAGEYVNAAILGYFAFPKDNAPDDEVSGKFSAMPHSGKNRTECFDMGMKIKNGATRIRYEAVHPNYTGDLGTGEKGLPLKTKYIGYMFVRKNLPNGNVLCEQWQDQGDNEGSAPANKWVKLFSWQDPKYQFKDYKDGHTITIRVDGSNVVKDMKLKWLCLVEIK